MGREFAPIDAGAKEGTAANGLCQDFPRKPQPKLAKSLKGLGIRLFASEPAYFWGESLWCDGPFAWGRMPVWE